MPKSISTSGLEEASSAPGSPASDKRSVENYRAPYVVEPTSPHTHTAILLHGLGSNGRAFGSFFLTASVMSTDKDSPYSRPLNALYPSMRWVFPTASLRRSARFNRIKLSSWFDIFSVQNPSFREETQIEGLVQSSQFLRDLIDEEAQKLRDAGVEREGERAEKRIVFGGLSQGCGISLTTLLSLDYALGGWVGMSGFMPMRGMFMQALKADAQVCEDGIVFQDDDAEQQTSTTTERSIHAQDVVPATKVLNAIRQEVLSIPVLKWTSPADVLETPAFYGHGSDDEKVNCKLGDELVETLRELKMNVKHQVYQGLGHWIQPPEEIDDMISVFTKNGVWPDHVDGNVNNIA